MFDFAYPKILLVNGGEGWEKEAANVQSVEDQQHNNVFVAEMLKNNIFGLINTLICPKLGFEVSNP